MSNFIPDMEKNIIGRLSQAINPYPFSLLKLIIFPAKGSSLDEVLEDLWELAQVLADAEYSLRDQKTQKRNSVSDVSRQYADADIHG